MSADDPLSAGLLRSVLDELPLGIWVARAPSGEVVYANRSNTEIFGAPGECTIELPKGLYDRQGRPYDRSELPFARAVRERARVVVDDLIVVRSETEQRHVRAVAQPLMDAKGALTHVVLVISDVSAQIKAEQEREAAQTQLLLALHHAPVVLFTTDRDGVITLSEGSGLRALDVASGDLVSASVYQMFAENESVISGIQRALQGESFTTVTQHGSSALESWVAPLRDERGEVQGVIGISTDITERQRLQQQVAHADRISALGRLAASVAHEINNPLSYTLEALRLCEERAATLERQFAAQRGGAPELLQELRRLLLDAAEGADRVRLITRDLTEFARADSGPRRAVSVDAAALAASKLVAKRSAAKARVQLDLACARSVKAEEHRLVQVFVNLIMNAADALPSIHAERNRIRVSTRAEDDRAIIEVADSGPGLTDADRAHLFEPFYSTKPVGEGTGLGLYVTHNIVTSLGGTIEALTAPEGGALFRVTLPLVAAGAGDEPEPRAERSNRPAPSAAPPVVAPPMLRPKVMVIDDELVLAQLFRIALQGECEVDIFDNGRAALERLLSGTRYDLIFCDLMMRDLSGMDLYNHLSSLSPGRERELIFMTGGTFDPDVSAFVSRIPNPCLTKPFDIRGEVRKRLRVVPLR